MIRYITVYLAGKSKLFTAFLLAVNNCILTSVICNLESCRLDISGPSGYGGAQSLLVTVETELACSLSSILSGKDPLEIGYSVEAILSEESFVSVETGLVKKLSIVFHLAFLRLDVMLSFNAERSRACIYTRNDDGCNSY